MGHTPRDIMHQAWLHYLSDNLAVMNTLHRRIWIHHLAAYEQQFAAKKRAALEAYNRAWQAVGGIVDLYPGVAHKLMHDVTAGMNRGMNLFVPRHTTRENFEQLFMQAAEANLTSGKRAVDVAVMHADWVFDRVASGLHMGLWDSKSVSDVGEEIKKAKSAALQGGIVRNEVEVGTPRVNNTPI